MTDKECGYGIAGRKWAYDNVVERCDGADYVGECGIDTAIHCEFRGTRREMRKHKKEHEKRHRGWSDKFDSKWNSEKLEFIDGLNDEYEKFKDRVWPTGRFEIGVKLSCDYGRSGAPLEATSAAMPVD